MKLVNHVFDAPNEPIYVTSLPASCKQIEVVVKQGLQGTCVLLFEQENHDVQIRVTAHKDARCQVFIGIIAPLQYTGSIHTQVESGAHIDVRVGYVVLQEGKIVLQTRQQHDVAHAQSLLKCKGVTADCASFSYDGMIYISPQGAGTYASQQNHNIVMGEKTIVRSVPNIEVLNNDVQCFHGSAIGQFEEEQATYMYAHGLSHERAKRLLLESFFGELVENIECGQQYIDLLCENL